MKEIKLLLKITGFLTSFVIALFIMTFALKMISAKSTIENIAGLFILMLLLSSITVIGTVTVKSIFKLKTNNNEKTI